jgi:hypothetical protein
MDVDWIFLYLMRFVVGYTLIFVTSLATKEWLKQNYPCFDQHYNPVDPKPNQVPTRKKKFLLSLYPSLCALGGALCISLLFSGQRLSFINIFVLISCFMLPAVWNTIVVYFRKMVEIQREFKIFRDAGLLSEWNKKWEDYLD